MCVCVFFRNKKNYVNIKIHLFSSEMWEIVPIVWQLDEFCDRRIESKDTKVVYHSGRNGTIKQAGYCTRDRYPDIVSNIK